MEVAFQPGQSRTPAQQTMCVTGVDFVIGFLEITTVFAC